MSNKQTGNKCYICDKEDGCFNFNNRMLCKTCANAIIDRLGDRLQGNTYRDALIKSIESAKRGKE